MAALAQPLAIRLLRRRFLISASAFGAFALAACAAPDASTGGTTREKLRVGLLPIVDSLPIYVAEADGFFKANNLDVELTLFASALERDAAFQAGQLDLELNDLVSAVLLNKDEASARVIRLAYRGNPMMPMMTILAAPSSSIRTPADLKYVPIGISGNSVIEYSTDRMLTVAGLASGEIQKTEVTKIPIRMEMLAKGQLPAATLPEPFASLALVQGAHRVVDDGATGIGCSVITARKGIIDKRAADLQAFLTAYDQGVAAVATAPEKYRALFVDKAKIPEQIQASLAIPPFPGAEVPTREDVTPVVGWAVSKGLIPKEIGYESMVNSTLLPAGK